VFFLNFIILALGLTALYFGAKLLIDGGSRLASLMGIAPMVIGLTVVSIGTSLPELTIGIASASNGHTSISLGNIIGSNICNLLLILAVAAVIRPLPMRDATIRDDIPALVASAGIVWILASDGLLGRFDGIILLLAFALFTFFVLKKNKPSLPARKYPANVKGISINIIMVLFGLGLLILGGSGTVKSGVNIAKAIGIPEAIIALTLIAFGTSLPELVTCAVASYKKESQIAVGNVLGSNICNTLLVLGLVAVIEPIVISPDLLKFSFPVMVLASMAVLPFSRIEKRFSRAEGIAFLIAYIIYIIAIVY